MLIVYTRTYSKSSEASENPTNIIPTFPLIFGIVEPPTRCTSTLIYSSHFAPLVQTSLNNVLIKKTTGDRWVRCTQQLPLHFYIVFLFEDLRQADPVYILLHIPLPHITSPLSQVVVLEDLLSAPVYLLLTGVIEDGPCRNHFTCFSISDTYLLTPFQGVWFMASGISLRYFLNRWWSEESDLLPTGVFDK